MTGVSNRWLRTVVGLVMALGVGCRGGLPPGAATVAGADNPLVRRPSAQLGVTRVGPALVTGDWALAPTVSTSTDDRYDTPNTREYARRQEEAQLAARRYGDTPPDTMTPLVKALHVDKGPLGKVLPPPSDSQQAASAVGTKVAEEARAQVKEATPGAEPQVAALLPKELQLDPGRMAGCQPLTQGDSAAQARALRECVKQARDPRERTRWLLLALQAEGLPLPQAAQQTKLKLTCAQEVVTRFKLLQSPAIRTVVRPRDFLRDTCHARRPTSLANGQGGDASGLG